MKRLTAVFLGFLAISSMVAADPLYKWVDDKGNVHYSDKPQPGAKKIVLPPATTFKAPPVAPPNPALQQPQENGAADSTAYTAIIISSPADQDTLWNTDSVTVSVSTTPAWQTGEVTITVDGQTQTVNGTSASFTGLERGQHIATASVDGVKAPAVTFFIQKSTIKKPPAH